MTTLKTEGITGDGVDVTVSIEVTGDETQAETVHMHALDEIIKSMQAIHDNAHPDECVGRFVKPDWNARLETINGDEE